MRVASSEQCSIRPFQLVRLSSKTLSEKPRVMNDDSTEGKTKYCCISHEFFRVASANPNKVAVIHASGVAQVSRQLRENATSSDFKGDILELLDKRVESLSPPLYFGDRCYTYSDLLKAVLSLSSRLRSILLGVDDPHLIRTKAQG